MLIRFIIHKWLCTGGYWKPSRCSQNPGHVLQDHSWERRALIMWNNRCEQGYL